MADKSPRVYQTRANIVGFHPWISLHDHLWCVTAGQHAEYVFDRKPAAAHDRLASKDSRIDGYPSEEIVFILAKLNTHTK